MLGKSSFLGFTWLDPLGRKKAPGYSKKYRLTIDRAENEVKQATRY